MSLNVVPLPTRNLNDIAAMARKLADDIDGGEYGSTNACIVVLESDTGLVTFGWGDADDSMRVIGLLEAGKHDHLKAMFDDA